MSLADELKPSDLELAFIVKKRLKKYTEKVRRRFIRKIVINKDTGCWEVNKKRRYGSFTFIPANKTKSKTMSAHRVSWEMHNDMQLDSEIMGWFDSNSEVILHQCDNPSCVNPSHLLVGTQQDNMDDKVLKGRQTSGEAAVNSKLTEELVYRMRRLYKKKGLTQMQLATLFNVSQTTVSQIILNKIWTDIKYHPPASRLGKNGNTILTSEQVDEIRELFNSGEVTKYSDLCERYGVKKVIVSEIINNKKWFDSNYKRTRYDRETEETA